MKNNFSSSQGNSKLIFFITFFTTALLLIPVWLFVKPPMLLLERFVKGGGIVEAILLAIYAGFVAKILYEGKRYSRVRTFIWKLFSIVFFSQLFLGLVASSLFLMTGKLHLPIPGLIILGPVYRGTGLFMLILFLTTIVLVGPAWCSFLCYFGSWDDFSARSKKIPSKFVKHPWLIRISWLAFLVLFAFGLKKLSVSSSVATYLAIAFGVAGILVIIFVSRKKGYMSHCTLYCPAGIVATLLGKLHPFKITVNTNCTLCMACTVACKYGALDKERLIKKRPAATCTLCGDCVSVCPHDAIHFTIYHSQKSRKWTRELFIVIIVTLHAVFLGLARI